LNPLGFFRENGVRRMLVEERGSETKATGL
jgi:hypothetical protein